MAGDGKHGDLKCPRKEGCCSGEEGPCALKLGRGGSSCSGPLEAMVRTSLSLKGWEGLWG